MAHSTTFEGIKFIIFMYEGKMRFHSSNFLLSYVVDDNYIQRKIFTKRFREWVFEQQKHIHLKVNEKNKLSSYQRTTDKMEIIKIPILLPKTYFSYSETDIPSYEHQPTIQTFRQEAAQIVAHSHKLVNAASKGLYARQSRKATSPQAERLASACLAQAIAIQQGLEALCRMLESME